jgi:hypothetical protein
LAQVRAKLKAHPDSDRQFVKVLGAVLDHGLPAVEAACEEALMHSGLLHSQHSFV